MENKVGEILLHERLRINGREWMVEVWVGEDLKPKWCAWAGTRYRAPAADNGEGMCFDAVNPIYVPGEILKKVAAFSKVKENGDE